MKKYSALIFAISLVVAVSLFSPESVKAATAGPVDVQQLMAVKGPGPGQVTLSWKQFYPDTTNFHVVYGVASLTYIYGALNVATATGVGNAYSFTIGSLVQGQTYYFAIVPVRSGGPGATSMEVATAAKGGVVATTAPAAGATPMAVPVSGAPAPAYVASGSPSVLSSDPRPFNFTATGGTTRGTVNLSWLDKYTVANGFAIMYGTSPNQYMWGVPFIPEIAGGASTTFTVGGLTSGKTYYFALVALQNGNTVFITGPFNSVAR